MNTKAKGSRNERKSMRYLECLGYKCTKSAASLGEWDLVCVGGNDVILVQVKSNRWPRSNEMSAMQDFEAPKFVGKIIHRWDNNARKPKVKRFFEKGEWVEITE